MLPYFLFSLVLGGGALAFSLLGDLFGGGDVDLDTDLDLDLDLHLDAEIDVDTDFDLDGHDGEIFSQIFSIRSIVYGLFGFGGVGSLFSWLRPGASPTLVVVAAVLTGLASAYLVTAAFGYMKRSSSGAQPGETTFIGLTGSIHLPVGWDSAGSVIVERGSRRIELRALPHPSAADNEPPPNTWSSIVVVDMKQGVAHVSPVRGELLP